MYKNLLKSVLGISVLLLGMQLINGCSDKKWKNPTTLEIEEKLDLSQSVWNAEYGLNTQLTDWEFVENIATETIRGDVVDQATSYNSAWFPNIDESDTNNTYLVNVYDQPEVNTTAITTWKNDADNNIHLGDTVYRIHWTQFDQNITTIAVFDQNGSLVYDSVLSDIVRKEAVSQINPLALYTIGPSTIVAYNYCWIWQTSNCTRGSVKATIQTQCNDTDGSCVACDAPTCDAEMQLGDSKINCKKIKNARTCQVDVSYAVVTGFKSISVGADNFTLSVEGYLGYSDSGNPSATHTCELKCCDGTMQYDINDCPNECDEPNSCKTKECPDGSMVCPNDECPTD